MARIEDEDNPETPREDDVSPQQQEESSTTTDDDTMTPLERVDAFLDKPFFDPDDFDENDTSLLGKFANLVKADYELAETLYVGLIFVVLIIVTQEILRMQLYGDGYSPFVKGGGGKLF